jgi:ribosomal protein S8
MTDDGHFSDTGDLFDQITMANPYIGKGRIWTFVKNSTLAQEFVSAAILGYNVCVKEKVVALQRLQGFIQDAEHALNTAKELSDAVIDAQKNRIEEIENSLKQSLDHNEDLKKQITDLKYISERGLELLKQVIENQRNPLERQTQLKDKIETYISTTEKFLIDEQS